MAPIIEDWVSDTDDESETTAPQIAPSFVQTSEHVKPSRQSDQPIEAPILAATPKPTSPKSNRSGKIKNRKTCFMCRSVDHLIKDCNYHAMKKAQPTPRNYAHRGNNKHITRSSSPKTSNSPPRVTAAQTPVVSAAKGQTATGKEISNPFMAGSFPKTTLSTFIHEMMFKINLFHHVPYPLHHHNHLKIFHPHPKVAQDLEISKLQTRVKKLKRANKVKTLKLRRLKKVGTSQRVDTSDDTIMEDVSNQGRMIDELDRDEGVALMGEKEEEKKAEEVKVISSDAQVEGTQAEIQAEIYQIDMDHP
nr:hypothetical protein [Tanacetum cinerariifolium]